MNAHHLAQFNVGTLHAPLEDPRTAGFVALLDPLNALADRTDGLVWRLTGEGENDATSLRPLGEGVIVNFSVWRSREALWEYVYRSEHLEAMRSRREWFVPPAEPHLVLWWIPAGHTPTISEAIDRLELLRREGPGPRAFTFRACYAPDGTSVPARSAPLTGPAKEPEPGQSTPAA